MYHGRDAALDRHLGDVGGRLDTQARDLGGHRVLQQVAVVAGDLEHQAGSAELEALDHGVHVALGVLDPAVRVRAEIGVVGKDGLAAHVFVQLDQPALIADVGVERIERLHRIELVRAQEALTEGAHAEVHEGVDQGCGAGAAGSGRHRRPVFRVCIRPSNRNRVLLSKTCARGALSGHSPASPGPTAVRSCGTAPAGKVPCGMSPSPLQGAEALSAAASLHGRRGRALPRQCLRALSSTGLTGIVSPAGSTPARTSCWTFSPGMALEGRSSSWGGSQTGIRGSFGASPGQGTRLPATVGGTAGCRPDACRVP